jgi:hypothetical protein
VALKLAAMEYHIPLHIAASTPHDERGRDQLSWGKIISQLMMQMKFSGGVGVIFSSVLTIVIPIAILTSMIIFVIILKKTRTKRQFNSKLYTRKYGTLTEGLNTNAAIGTYWNVVILLRWLWTTSVLIFVRDHQEIQILSLLITSILFQCLILVG